mgnify:CR=1 FL=1
MPLDFLLLELKIYRITRNPDAALLERLQIDVSAFTCIDTGKYLRKTYEILEQTEGIVSGSAG